MRTRSLVGAWTALCALSSPTTALSERPDRLFVGADLVVRPNPADTTPRYELASVHGLAAEHTQLVVRFGVVLPIGDGAVALPAGFGLRWAPFDFPVRPLLGTDFGGTLSQARGPRQNDSPSSLEWTWNIRALAGVELATWSLFRLHAYADASWAQQPRDVRNRAQVFSGIGAGLAIIVRFEAPRWTLFDMLLRGTSAPEGF